MKKSKTKVNTKEPQTGNTRLMHYLVLAVIAFAVYANSLSNDFVFDDESVVLSDPTITSLSNIPKYFTGEEGFHKVIGRYYRPVVSASYAIDCSIYGLKPFGFHLTNVIIHIINSLLFFYLLTLIFSGVESKFKDYALLIGGAIFAVHPIHTEAVAWVSGRTDSLCFTFFIAAFINYLRYSEAKKNLYLWMTLVFYLLALLTKEMAITFPVIIILYDYIVKKKTNREGILENAKAYCFAAGLSLLFMLWRWYVLKDIPMRDTYMYFYGKNIYTVIFTMLQTLPYYFRLALAPYGMLYHYSNYLPYQSSLFNLSVIFSLVFFIVIIISAFYLIRRLPEASYAIFFFFITLSPVLNIVPTMNFMADRFLYIPSAMLSIILISIILKYYSEKSKGIIYTVCLIILVTYSFMTFARNADWKTNDSLFLSAEGKPGSVTLVNIGNIYANKQDYDKAAGYFREAISLRDETVLANNNLGKIFMLKNNFDSAYYYMYKAYKLDTLSPEPMYSLALLLANNNKFSESLGWLEKIQLYTPNYLSSVKMMEQLKDEIRNPNHPDTNLQKMPQVPGKNPDSNVNIQELEKQSYDLYQEKNYSQAIAILNKLTKINPSNASGYYNNIGMCYLDQDKLEFAEKSFKMAIESNKNFSTGYNNLGNTYLKMGDKQRAKESFENALKVDPNNQDAKNNLEKLK